MTEVHKPGTGAIFGIVTEEGIAKDESPVYLYDMRRWDGAGKKKLLARRFTRQDGGFEFAGLNTNYGDYMVMVTDEDGDEPKNALVQDRVNPIPAHAGSGLINEWYVRAMRDGAAAGIIAWPVIQDGPGEPAPFGLGIRPTQKDADPVSWVPMETPPAEILNMSSFQMNPLGYGPMAYGKYIQSAAGSASLELIVDLDSIVTSGGDCVFAGIQHGASGTFTSMSTTGNSSCSYTPRKNQLKLAVLIGTDKVARVYSGAANSCRQNWNASPVLVGTFDLSAYSAETHLIFTFQATSHTNCFVNGVEQGLQVTAHAGGIYSIYQNSSPGYLTETPAVVGFGAGLADQALTAGGRTHRASLFVQYNRALTTQEAQDHYAALYNNALTPPISGYARAVFEDTPHMYWRLDDFDAETRTSFASDVAWRDPNTGVGDSAERLNSSGGVLLVDPLVQSPIAGRQTVGVVQGNGNFWSSTTAGSYGWLFRDRGSLSCWVKFDLATPVVSEFIAEFDLRESSSPYLDLYRDTSNQLVVRIWEGSVLNTYTLADYTPPQGEWQHISITIDKTGAIDATNGLLKLYVGSEVSAPVLVQTLLLSKETALYTSVSFATAATGNTMDVPQTKRNVSIMKDLTGSVCELAVFPDILTPDRIEAHWNARTVV